MDSFHTSQPDRPGTSTDHVLFSAPIHTHQLRDATPSPPHPNRPRNAKASSMPIVPNTNTFTTQPFPGQPPMQQQPSAAPSVTSANSRRSPQLAPGQMQRLLPTPPQPQPPNYQEGSDQHRQSPVTSQPQTNVSTHYHRPIPRQPPASFLPNYQDDDDQYHMTPELEAQIDYAAAQAQYQALPHSYPSAPRGESPSPSPARAPPNVDRVRGLPPDRSSPNNPDNNSQSQQQPQSQQPHRRETQQLPRDSPKSRPREPASGQIQSSERKVSPGQHSPMILSGGINDPHPSSYLAQYNAREREARLQESPPSIRRPTNNADGRLNPSSTSSAPGSTVNANQTTPPQPAPMVVARNPDRSLPLQEEAEDEIAPNTANKPPVPPTRESWRTTASAEDQHFHSSSPTPSSDLNPEGSPNATRHHQDDSGQPQPTLPQHNANPANVTSNERDSAAEESGGYTPRSPTVSLPDEYSNSQPLRVLPGRGQQGQVPHPNAVKPRNGATDHQMRSLDGTLGFDTNSNTGGGAVHQDKVSTSSPSFGPP